jgi:hypothetical protein
MLKYHHYVQSPLTSSSYAGVQDCLWLKVGQVVGACECGNEPSGSIKCGEFIDWLKTG